MPSHNERLLAGLIRKPEDISKRCAFGKVPREMKPARRSTDCLLPCSNHPECLPPVDGGILHVRV